MVLTPDGGTMVDRSYSLYYGVEEVFLLNGTYAPVKLYHFISGRKGVDREALRQEWQSLQTELLREIFSDGVRRAVLGRALEAASATDATLQISFEAIAQAEAFHTKWMARMAERPGTLGRLGHHVVFPAFVSLFYDRRFYT